MEIAKVSRKITRIVDAINWEIVSDKKDDQIDILKGVDQYIVDLITSIERRKE